jgi:O-antigen/teichoic acid export membrane protein
LKTKNLLWFIFGPISTAGLSFFLVPLIAWIFPQEDIGRVSLLISISGFTTVLFCLGLDQAYVREFNEYKFRNKLFFNAIVPGLLAAIITFASILVIAPELISETIIGVGSLGLSVFAIIYFIVLFLTRFLSLTLRMEEKGKQFSISQILPKLVFAGVVFITALLVLKPSFYSLLIAHGLS